MLVAVKTQSKKDMTKDLLLLFSAKVKVKFVRMDGVTDQAEGRWCNICKSVIVINDACTFPSDLPISKGRIWTL